jgi:multisubunit Na+/H+ antiporter MnhB subunit
VVLVVVTGNAAGGGKSAFCIVSIAVVIVSDLGSPVISGKKRTTRSTPTPKLNPIKVKRDLFI